jgi:hypothetical protein
VVRKGLELRLGEGERRVAVVVHALPWLVGMGGERLCRWCLCGGCVFACVRVRMCACSRVLVRVTRALAYGCAHAWVCGCVCERVCKWWV